MVKVWKIAPGEYAKDWELLRDAKCISVGWDLLNDFRRYKSKKELFDALQIHYKGRKGCGKGAATMIWQFVHEVAVNDVVVANRGFNQAVGIGVVTSEYLPPNSKNNPIRGNTSTIRHQVRLIDWRVKEAIYLPGYQLFHEWALKPFAPVLFDHLRKAYEGSFPRLRETFARMRDGNSNDNCIPQEIADGDEYYEGEVRTIRVNAYERDEAARKKCIEVRGTACCICEYKLEEIYGDVAEGYIHVHHLHPLSKRRRRHAVDPVKDLRPVCPNCHAVLHLGGECRSIEEMRKLLIKRPRR